MSSPQSKVASDVERLGVYQDYVRKFGVGADGPTDRWAWHPRRSCCQDWLISVQVVRWTRQSYEIGLFLAEDVWFLEKRSGVKAGLMFILSDAYHQTGRMEIHFVGAHEGREPTIQTGHEPSIPESIKELGRELGVPVEGQEVEGHGRDRNSRLTRLDDKTGRALYAKVTGFSEKAVKALSREDSQLDLTRACFIVQRGVWAVEQVEYIAQEAYDPPRLLEGGITPENRLSFQHDLCVLRTALAWERTRVIMEALSSGQTVPVATSGWTGNLVEFTANQELRVKCLDGEVAVEKGRPTRVLLLPRAKGGYQTFQSADVEAVQVLKPKFVAVTKDFLGQDSSQIRAAGAEVLCLYDTQAELDGEAYRRLARSVSTKRSMPEHAE